MDQTLRYPLILLVDDDPITRRTVERILRRTYAQKADIRVYDGGQKLFDDLDAIKVYQKIMLMTDATMPGMMGHEVVRRLRLELGNLLRKCVFMSGALVKHQQSIIGLDVIPLERPFNIQDMYALVSDFLSGN